MPFTLLVTGANGFLARAVASLAPADWQLHGLIREGSTNVSGSRWRSLHTCIDSIKSEGHRFDAVIHLAACIPANIADFDARLLAVNVMLPTLLLQEMPAARHVLASSVAVYGRPASLPLSVASAAMPSTPYGWSKLTAEAVVKLARSHAILRLSSIIGPGLRAGSFIPAAVAAARTGHINLHGDGTRTQDYIDVRDAARQCIAAIGRDDNFLTLAVSGRAHSNREVADELATLTGAEVGFNGEDASTSYAYALTGAVALGPCMISLRESLTDMVRE